MIITALVIVVRVSVLLAGAGLLVRSLRGSSAATRHLVWTAAIAGALIVPVLTLVAPPFELAVLPASALPATSPALSIQLPAGNSEQPRSTAPAFVARAESGIVSPAAGRPAAWPSPARTAVWIWLIGVGLVLARFALGTARMRWIARRARRVDGGTWLRLAGRLAWLIGVKRRVTFLEGTTAAMPMTWGIVNPCILLPESASRWPSARQRVVLLHELAHVKRRDCLTQLLAQLLCALYWFNPLSWIAARRLEAERERACDDVVIAAGTRGSDYADHLLDIARAMRSSMLPTWAAVAMAHRSQLEGRLMAILDPQVPRQFPTRSRTIALVACVAVLVVSIALITPAPRAAEALSSSQPIESMTQPLAAPVPNPAPQPEGAAAEAVPRARRASESSLASVMREALKDAVPDATKDLVREGWIPSAARFTVEAVGAGVGQAVGGVSGGVPGGIAGGVKGGVEGAVSQETEREVEKETDIEREASRDPRVVAALVEALKDSDKEVRESAMQALANMRAPEALEPIRGSLKDTNPSVRQQAASALGQYRDRSSVDALVGALQDSSPDVREQAVFALGQIRDSRAAGPLGQALKDSNAQVREQAAFALGQLRSQEAVESLTAALRDQSANVREQAAFALGQIRDRRAVEPLLGALKDESASVREQAAFALGQLRDPRAAEALTAALKDANVEVRRQAAFALGQLSR